MAAKKKSTPQKMSDMSGDNCSIEFRKIENGFLVRKSFSKGKGNRQTYQTKEYYSPIKPVMKLGSK